jgi:hypothetical protein
MFNDEYMALVYNEHHQIPYIFSIKFEFCSILLLIYVLM